MATMRAVRMHEYGDPEVIVCEEVPRPEPAADEVLIHVQAAGVNPVDWKIREGFGKDSARNGSATNCRCRPGRSPGRAARQS